MGQRETGPWGVLARPTVYGWYQRLVGERRVRRMFVEEHVRPQRGDVVLDVGCGTADILDVLDLRNGATYIGFDPSPAYVEWARRRHGDRGRFFVAGVEDVGPSDVGSVDVVIGFGVVHHLDDNDAERFFSLARAVVGEEGRCVTLDPFFEERQSAIERFMVRNDRGGNVRTVADYLALAGASFDHVQTTLHPGLLRLPFPHTHRVVECSAAPLLARPKLPR